MIEAAMRAGQLPVLVSLGRHDLELAKAAVDAGAFGLKFHLNAYHRARARRSAALPRSGASSKRWPSWGSPCLS